MNKKLIREVAADITRAIIERIRWEREEQMAEAFEEFFPVVYCRIHEYESSRLWCRRNRRGRKQSERGEPDQPSGWPELPPLLPEGERPDD